MEKDTLQVRTYSDYVFSVLSRNILIVVIIQAMSSENKPLLEEDSRQRIGERSELTGSWLQEAGLPQGQTSPLGAIFIIINAALGGGLLTFPVAFYSAGGILPALLVMAVSDSRLYT